MTPKEKAAEIYDKFLDKIKGLEGSEWWESAKQCALIAVDELIKEQTMWQNGEVNPILYWQEVKKEIELL